MQLYPNFFIKVYFHLLYKTHELYCILLQAMFEGILVDLPFATFFLSKLKQKYYKFDPFSFLSVHFFC